jgi:hypothetical protein
MLAFKSCHFRSVAKMGLAKVEQQNITHQQWKWIGCSNLTRRAYGLILPGGHLNAIIKPK